MVSNNNPYTWISAEIIRIAITWLMEKVLFFFFFLQSIYPIYWTQMTNICRFRNIITEDLLLFSVLFDVNNFNSFRLKKEPFRDDTLAPGKLSSFFSTSDWSRQRVLHSCVYCPSVSAGQCRIWKTPRSPHVTRETSTTAAPPATSPPPVIQDPAAAAPGPSSLDMMGTGPQHCYFFWNGL